MAKTDWRFADTVIPEDLNGIGEEINGLRTDISTRFDHADTTPLTLQPGLQVVHAEKDARFKLGEIRGRTLVNLLGQMGSMDSLNGWRYDPNAAVLDSTDKIEGTASVKGVISNGLYSDIFYSFPYESSKRYIALGELKTHGGATARIRVVESEGLVELSSPLLSSNIFSTAFFKVPLNAITSGKTVYFGTVFAGNNGSGGNVDALRIYEISDAEYQALDEMTPEQVAMKYPFVPSGIIGVENPYVVNKSGNLLPPFYEWTIVEPDKVKIQAPYTLSITNGTVGATIYTDLPAKSGDIFTLYGQIEDSNVKGYLTVGFYRDNELLSWGLEIYSNSDPASFICPDGTTSIKIVCAVQESNLNPITYSRPTLSIGSGPVSFREQHKSMLAFQADLYANPEDSSDTDILFEQDGEYRKLTKWEKIVLDGSLEWEGAGNSGSTEQDPYVILRAKLPKRGVFGSQFVTKYDNYKLNKAQAGVWGRSDSAILADDNYIYISISNADSGWGVNYTPTAEEIKAYFNGWRMCNGNTSLLYTGASGEIKCWGPIANPQNVINFGGWIDYVLNNAPTYEAPVSGGYEYHHYNLLYRLAKETIAPIVTEGSLLLTEGNNMVEVGTGIVLRERANPIYTGDVYNSYNINNFATTSKLKSKASAIVRVYRDNASDFKWQLATKTADDFGTGFALIDAANYDPSAAYSVTYLNLDKSPIQLISGTLAANDKAQMSDLTAGVAEALQRVSVVEQKKAEKDAPGWITPTLLNGATPYGALTPQYMKQGDRVYLRGQVVLTALNVDVFKLPEGYRPVRLMRFAGYAYSTQTTVGEIIITESGTVVVPTGGLAATSFDGISFLAEQ